MKLSILVVAGLSLLNLISCVEIRDKNDEQNVQVVEARNLTIDEAHFLVDGELVSFSSLKQKVPAFSRAELGKRTLYKFNFDHLVIKDGAIIYTMGNDVEFNIKDLESDGGAIRTMTHPMVAANSTDGISGGSIRLNIEHARGDLFLGLIGESGGRGYQGGESDWKGDATNSRCYQSNSGGQGGNGGRGGFAGQAEVVIQDDANFQFKYQMIPGVGGEGGQGGGAIPYCLMIPGAVDTSGLKGSKGADGRVGEICITYGNGSRQCSN
jgi:hypothetical protein